MSNDRPKRDSMSLDEATISNMWGIAEAPRLVSEWKPKGHKYETET